MPKFLVDIEVTMQVHDVRVYSEFDTPTDQELYDAAILQTMSHLEIENGGPACIYPTKVGRVTEMQRISPIPEA